MPRSGYDPDSAHSRSKLERALANPPTPPFPLTADQQVVWNAILKTRAPSEWQGIDGWLASDLCIATIALRDARLRLVDEDPVLVGPRGGLTVNPMMIVASSLLNQTLRLSGRLRLSAQDTDSMDANSTATARKRKREAEHRDELSQDDADLIARPRPTPVN